MGFHETNNISWNFSVIILGFHEVAKYYVDFQFCFLVLSKDDCKISVSLEQIQDFEVSNLAMAKVKEVNIAVT
jgi:hypothetical protein